MDSLTLFTYLLFTQVVQFEELNGIWPVLGCGGGG